MSSLPIRLVVNGQPVQAQTEPRTLLGDFLREELRLTGLHLACEHGVCGGCNVQIDGDLSRACTQLAARCEGRQVRTIEGFEGDALMESLRAAFSIEHALQCGYCTPGMLMTAHDIVRRFPQPDEATVRRELSGNLCRCTGYAGIVRAILRVAGERDDWAVVSAPVTAPVARAVEVVAAPTSRPASDGGEPKGTEESKAARIPEPMPLPASGLANTISKAFSLPAGIDEVWRFFGDVGVVAACMPGLEVQEVQDNERLRGVFTVKAGPIRAIFATIARVTRDDAACSGRVESEGRDRLTRSITLARLDYQLQANEESGATDIRIAAAFHIEGRLAEFSRPEVVAALATQLTERFAANVERRLTAGDAEPPTQAAALELSLAGMVCDWLRQVRRQIAAGLRRLAFWK